MELNWSKSFTGCPLWKWELLTFSVSRIFFSAVSPWLTTVIHLSLRFLVSSSYSSSWSVMIWGIRKNPRPLCLPLLDPNPHTMHMTIVNSPTFPRTSFSFRSLCLLSRDTNMAASNRCQAKGQVAEKQEFSAHAIRTIWEEEYPFHHFLLESVQTLVPRASSKQQPPVTPWLHFLVATVRGHWVSNAVTSIDVLWLVMALPRESHSKKIQSKNKSVYENAVTEIWESCMLLLIGSCSCLSHKGVRILFFITALGDCVGSIYKS